MISDCCGIQWCEQCTCRIRSRWWSSWQEQRWLIPPFPPKFYYLFLLVRKDNLTFRLLFFFFNEWSASGFPHTHDFEMFLGAFGTAAVRYRNYQNTKLSEKYCPAAYLLFSGKPFFCFHIFLNNFLEISIYSLWDNTSAFKARWHATFSYYSYSGAFCFREHYAKMQKQNIMEWKRNTRFWAINFHWKEENDTCRSRKTSSKEVTSVSYTVALHETSDTTLQISQPCVFLLFSYNLNLSVRDERWQSGCCFIFLWR